jgi:hypothetical protein
MVFSNNSLTWDRLVHDFLWQFRDLWQISTWFLQKTMHWPVTSQWIVRENLVLTFHKSLNCQRKSCTNLSQVTELTIHLLVTDQWMVFSNNSVTCDRLVHDFLWQFSDLWKVSTRFSLTIHWLVTGLNCWRKSCPNLSQVTELLDKTMYSAVISHWIVRENHVLSCHKSLNCYRVSIWFSLTIQWLVTG